MKKRLRALSKVTNIILSVAVLLILPLVVSTLISSKTDRLLGIRSFVVLTGSMEPNLSVGSVVFTKPSTVYKAGDVIAFNQGGRTVTHRVVNAQIKEKNIEYTTKGDANNSKDSEAVLGEQVVGKQMFSIPYLGRFIIFLSTMEGFVLFIVSPIVIFILLELRNIKKEMERQIEAKLFKEMFAQKPQ